MHQVNGVNDGTPEALLEKAETYRRLALEILEGPFSRDLIDLANEYARRAALMEAQVGRGKAALRPAE